MKSPTKRPITLRLDYVYKINWNSKDIEAVFHCGILGRGWKKSRPMFRDIKSRKTFILKYWRRHVIKRLRKITEDD